MNIKNCTNAVNAYKATAFDKELKTKPFSGAKAKNTDKAEFSTAKGNLDGIKSAAVKSADAQASAERIAALRSQIAEGKYNISSENIALSVTEA